MGNNLKKLEKILNFLSDNEELCNEYDAFSDNLRKLFNETFTDIDLNFKKGIVYKASCKTDFLKFLTCDLDIQDESLKQIIHTYFINYFRSDDEPLSVKYYSKEHFPIIETSSQHYSLMYLIEEYINQNKFDYYSQVFRKLRLDVFIRDGEKCAKCGIIPKPGVSLTIDHIKPVSKYPELSLDINNLQVLCWECNQEKSNKNEINYRGK